MESSSKISDFIEILKSKLSTMKYPLKQNLDNLHELLSLFDEATTALLNPIKKLKISYNMRINSFKGKYESVLTGIKSKIAFYDKNKNSKNFNSSAYLEETSKQNKEFHNEHNKLMLLLEECLHSISALNKLFDTKEFQKLDKLTQCLRSAKKKTKAPILSLNEDDEDNFNLIHDINSPRSINAKNNNGHANLNGKSSIKKNCNNSNIGIEEIDNSREDENEVTIIASTSSFKNNNKTNKKNINKAFTSNNKNSHTLSKQNSDNVNNRKVTACYNGAENNSDNSEKGFDSKYRRLTEEECLEKMKELFKEEKGLTKTFLTRKLKKRIMINRKLDFNSEETYKEVELSIPKKSGPNSYLKVSMEICDKAELNLSSSLMCFMKDFFNAYFIVFKNKNKKMKIVIGGHLTKDIINFMKKVSSEEFKNKYSVLTMKIKAYAFYEELITEFYNKEGVIAKQINDAEIKVYLEHFSHLTKMRKAYEEVKLMKVDN